MTHQNTYTPQAAGSAASVPAHDRRHASKRKDLPAAGVHSTSVQMASSVANGAPATRCHAVAAPVAGLAASAVVPWTVKLWRLARFL